MKSTRTALRFSLERFGTILLAYYTPKNYPDIHLYWVDVLAQVLLLYINFFKPSHRIQIICTAGAALLLLLPMLHDWKYMFAPERCTFIDEGNADRTARIYRCTFSLRLFVAVLVFIVGSILLLHKALM